MAIEDKKALFDEILTEHKDVIYRVCWGFTSLKEDVDDLFQEVLLNVWKGLDKFRMDSKSSTWLHRIAINTCLIWKRKETKEVSIKSKNADFLKAQHSGETEEINPHIVQLRRTIQKLNPTDRSMIILLMEGHTYQEIAEITGVTSNNVGVKISRAKVRIKKLINQTKL